MAASYLKSFDEDLTSNDLVFARKHVIRRLCLVSKDPHAHKETAIYTVDSILRHAAVDEELRVKYEKHFQLHLRNLFKRALQMDSTRVSLAEKFFGKILTKWKAKKWFDNELEAIVQVVHNSAPNVPKPATLQPQYLSGRRSSAGSDASGMGDIGNKNSNNHKNSKNKNDINNNNNNNKRKKNNNKNNKNNNNNNNNNNNSSNNSNNSNNNKR
ncbi:unnamed protein product [Polarella glacialis]|uniref:CID domain-containing protein n=1 Tax=Polarella glacialis TaxID=89957 RepID=A0A813EJC9_POLGL|nr:unnamed protein product [Polarella glacialis]